MSFLRIKLLPFLCFVILPIVLITMGEFVLKINVNTLLGAGDLLNQQELSLVSTLLVILQTPKLLFAYGILGVGGLLWLMALSRFELSFLYPFFSLNYLVVVGGSQFILKETVSPTRYLAVILIFIGLIFISRSPNTEA